MNIKTTALTLTGLIALALLTSCGGGSGSDSGISDPQQQPNGNLPSGSGLNGGLTGRIISVRSDSIADRDELVQFDLFTGQYSELSIDSIQDSLARNGQSESDGFATQESYFGATSTSSTFYVQTVPQCVRDEEIVENFDSCVAIYGDDLQKLTQLRMNDLELNWPAKLSPSGKYLAVHEYDFRPVSSTFVLLDVAASTRIDRFAVDIETSQQELAADNAPLAWTPNDELVYTVPSDQRVIVYITMPGSLEVARTIRLPAIYQGEVTSLDVSPDGTKLLMGYNAFRFPPESDVNGVLLLDFETLTVTVPAIAESDPTTVPLGDNIQGNIRAPIWSPDGQWIMVLEGRNIFAGNVGNLSVNELLFAVPANKDSTLLTLDSPTEAIVIKLEHPSFPGTLVEGWRAGNFRYDASYDWIP